MFLIHFYLYIFSLLKLWQLLTWTNLVFLVLDVCLPAWDFTSDLILTTKYWIGASFDWVKTFDKNFLNHEIS